ncbi:MAG: energy transducer TonB [Aromatoleum sp.]|nr:energy transducer TonB [Aromatoleum sp.]
MSDLDFPRAPDRPLLWSLAASLVLHALVVGTSPRSAKIPETVARSAAGTPGPLQVLLEAGRVAAAPAPVEVERAVVPFELVPEEIPVEAPAMREARPRAGQPLGSPLASAATASAEAADPLGSIAIGPLKDAENLGLLAAAELALRYPTPAQRPPRLQGTLIAAYPLNALRARVERRVTVLLTIDADGAITAARVTPDDPDFGPAALAALQGAHFQPADFDGKPIPYWAILEFLFTVPDVSQPRAAK